MNLSEYEREAVGIRTRSPIEFPLRARSTARARGPGESPSSPRRSGNLASFCKTVNTKRVKIRWSERGEANGEKWVATSERTSDERKTSNWRSVCAQSVRGREETRPQSRDDEGEIE